MSYMNRLTNFLLSDMIITINKQTTKEFKMAYTNYDDDYRMDTLDMLADQWEERQQVLEELASERALQKLEEFGFQDDDGDDDWDEEPYDWAVCQQELEDFEGLQFEDMGVWEGF